MFIPLLVAVGGVWLIMSMVNLFTFQFYGLGNASMSLVAMDFGMLIMSIAWACALRAFFGDYWGEAPAAPKKRPPPKKSHVPRLVNAVGLVPALVRRVWENGLLGYLPLVIASGLMTTGAINVLAASGRFSYGPERGMVEAFLLLIFTLLFAPAILVPALWFVAAREEFDRGKHAFYLGAVSFLVSIVALTFCFVWYEKTKETGSIPFFLGLITTLVVAVWEWWTFRPKPEPCKLKVDVDIRPKTLRQRNPLQGIKWQVPKISRKGWMVIGVMVIIFVVFLWIGYSVGHNVTPSETGNPPQLGRLTVKVTDGGNGKGIEGALISVIVTETIVYNVFTDGNGFGYVENLPAGTYKVYAEKPSGYYMSGKSIEFRPGRPETTEVQLRLVADLPAKVPSATPSPVPTAPTAPSVTSTPTRIPTATPAFTPPAARPSATPTATVTPTRTPTLVPLVSPTPTIKRKT